MLGDQLRLPAGSALVAPTGGNDCLLAPQTLAGQQPALVVAQDEVLTRVLDALHRSQPIPVTDVLEWQAPSPPS